MKKAAKKLLTFVMAIAMLIGSVPISAFALQTSDTPKSYDMQVGKSYIVPIKAWGTDGEARQNVRSALFYGSNNAIVTPEESGKYKVTIQANNYDKMVAFQIYKQGTFKDDTALADIKCASYGLDDYPYRDKMIETGWLDTANDKKCYSPDEITVSGNDYSDNKYLTFEVDNLKDFLYTAQIEYTEGSFKSDWRTDRSSSDLIHSKLCFDTSDN